MVRVVAVLMLILPAWVFAQGKVELNKITRVEVKDGAVEITGSRTPNFNTFTMTDPPRLVIDISEAVFSGVPEVIPGQGTITGVKTASYGSASSAIARVLVGFDHEVETDLATSGTTVTVKVLGGAPTLAQRGATGPTGEVVAQAPDSQEQQKAAAEAQARAEQERAAQEKAAREAAARAEEDRKREAAERQKAEEAARAEQQRAAEAAKQAEEARKAEEAAQRKAAEEAARRAEADRKAQEEAARKAAEEARKQAEREAAEKAKRDAEERRRLQEEARKSQEAAKKAAEQERQRQLADERAAKERAEAERRQQQEEARKAAEEAKKAAEEQRRAEAKAAREAKAQAEEDRRRLAAQERAQRDEEARAQREQKRAQGTTTRPSGARRTLSFVGFRPVGRDARVTIKTDGPPVYELREADERTVIVVLANTRIGAHNNALFLDTSFFATPVLRVNPTQVGGDVEVEITLKGPVPYQAKQQGDDLVLEFQGR